MPGVFSQLINEKITDFVKDNVKQTLVGSIEKFDDQKMTADVKIFLKVVIGDEEPTDFGTLPNVPVNFLYAGGYFIKPPYKKGDLVTVSFCTHDIDKALEKVSKEDHEAFNLSSAVVVNGVAPANFSVPSGMEKKGLTIGAEDVYIQLSKDDDLIELKNSTSTVTIDGGSVKIDNGTGNFELKSSGQVDINGNFTVDV